MDGDRKQRNASKTKRKWFVPQFRLRDVFWIFVLTGVLSLWYRDREQLKQQHEGYTTVSRPSWSIDQVLGASDTVGPGDIQTAWAAQSSSSQLEWLILEFPKTTKVQTVHIHAWCGVSN